jgi:hypothetical protein
MTNWNDWFCVLTVQVFICFFDTVWAFLATHLRDLKAMATLYEGRGTTSNPKLKSHHWKNGGQSWPIPMNDHHWMHMFNPLWLLKSTILHGVYSEYPASWCWNSNFKWFPVIKNTNFHGFNPNLTTGKRLYHLENPNFWFLNMSHSQFWRLHNTIGIYMYTWLYIAARDGC